MSSKVDSANTSKDQKLPDEKALKQAAAASQKAIEAQGAAQSLRNAASTVTDPKKREQFLRDAYNKEIEAHGSSKKARMLSSGAFQGTIGGAGIGGAVSVGLGTVVGTVVGGLTAIPATGLGALVGSGVGAVHGPFIKLGALASGKDGKNGKNGKGEESENDGKGKAGDSEEINEDDEDVVPDPEVLRQAADAVEKERANQGEKETSKDAKTKKKPRKIEIRSKQQ